jgi:2-keto-3-deoxy-L-rhamnonate aldolase RhmA
MPFRPNRLKARLEAGNSGLGCWQFTSSPDVAEILSLCGFDALLVDHEHGPGGLESLIGILRAAGRGDATLLVRVPWNDPVYLKRVLDCGVEGVMIPMLENADQARAAVAACRYPPRGTRGAAYTVARAGDYGLAQDYPERIDERLLVIGQVESLAAIERVPEMATVDGLDMLLIGPLDLSGSAGALGRMDDPAVRDAIARSERAILDSGVWLGGVAAGPDDAGAMLARGYQLVMATSDLHLLRDGGRDLVAALGARSG